MKNRPICDISLLSVHTVQCHHTNWMELSSLDSRSSKSNQQLSAYKSHEDKIQINRFSDTFFPDTTQSKQVTMSRSCELKINESRKATYTQSKQHIENVKKHYLLSLSNHFGGSTHTAFGRLFEIRRRQLRIFSSYWKLLSM